MSLKFNIHREICSKLFDPLYEENIWRILVLDEYSTQIIAKILKMHDLFDKGITLVDDLNKRREPVPLEAIYLLTPEKSKIELMLHDFESTPVYSKAHVFFIDECNMDNLRLISESVAANYILTLKEMNIKFLIDESQLFHFDFQQGQNTFGSFNDLDDYLSWEMARSIASLCDILNENPNIYYQTTEEAHRFAIKVQQEMFKIEEENGFMGHTMHKDRSVLLILDRSVDPLTPILHDLHLQCLAYDILDIKNDTYSYKNFDTQKLVNVDLSESDDLWIQLRHNHIADVSRILPVKLKQLASAQKSIDNTVNGADNPNKTPDSGGEPTSNKDMVRKQLHLMVKKMPHLRQEAASVGNMFYLSEACLSAFQAGVNQLCECEQNLALGTDASGNLIKNPDKLVVSVINNTMATMSEKIRLLLTLIITQSGMTDSAITELIEKLRIDDRCNDILTGMTKIGNFILSKDMNTLKAPVKLYPFLIKNRKNILNGSSYTLSRWIPFIEDLIADAIRGNFNPSLVGKLDQPRLSPDYLKPDLNGYILPQRKSWLKSNEAEIHVGPRLIIFIIGGVSFAESRVVYNYTKLCSAIRTGNIPDQIKKDINFPIESAGGRGWNWEVLIGGTSILTPERYLNFLSKTK